MPDKEYVLEHAIGTYYVERADGIGGWSIWLSDAKCFNSIEEAGDRRLSFSAKSSIYIVEAELAKFIDDKLAEF